jgi:hypothetical protein
VSASALRRQEPSCRYRLAGDPHRMDGWAGDFFRRRFGEISTIVDHRQISIASSSLQIRRDMER